MFHLDFSLHGIVRDGKRLLESAIDLAEFPEDRKQKNCDHEQQKWHIHFLASFG
jgi:hypothetical protein